MDGAILKKAWRIALFQSKEAVYGGKSEKREEHLE